MAYNHVSSEYTRTYTSFSGCDIVCTFGNVVIGELQAISYSISRETKFSVSRGNFRQYTPKKPENPTKINP